MTRLTHGFVNTVLWDHFPVEDVRKSSNWRTLWRNMLAHISRHWHCLVTVCARKCVLPLSIWKGIWEFTQEKSLTLVIFAVSVSAMGILWKITDKEHTVESQIANLILRIALHWFKEIQCKSNVQQSPLRNFPN